MKQDNIQIIWRDVIYTNGFHCPVCGALLFDPKANTPTDALGFDTIPGQFYPARCFCMRCGTPAAFTREYTGNQKPGLLGLWPNSDAPERDAAREKVEVKMYAVGISTDEAWEWVAQREEEFLRILKEAKVKAIHPDPQGRFQAFLYLHPKARNKAYKVLKEHFKTAFVVAETAYVNAADFG